MLARGVRHASHLEAHMLCQIAEGGQQLPVVVNAPQTVPVIEAVIAVLNRTPQVVRLLVPAIPARLHVSKWKGVPGLQFIRAEPVHNCWCIRTFSRSGAHRKETCVGLEGGIDVESQKMASLFSSPTSVTGVTRTSTLRVKARTVSRHDSRLPAVA